MQNISAPFICEVPPFKATLDKAIGMADFVFGNETEAAAFGKVEGWESTDVAEIALKISQTKAGAKAPTVVRLHSPHRRAVLCRNRTAALPATSFCGTARSFELVHCRSSSRR